MITRLLHGARHPQVPAGADGLQEPEPLRRNPEQLLHRASEVRGRPLRRRSPEPVHRAEVEAKQRFLLST